MPVVNREGFTVRVLRSGSSAGAGLGFLITDRHIVTCAHVVNVALGKDRLAQEKPGEDTLIQVEFSLLGDSGGAPVRSCTVQKWVPPPTSGIFGGDVAGLEVTRGDLPPGAGPARAIDPAALRGVLADTFGYPADPDRQQVGAWSRHLLRGGVGRGILQLDSTSESAIRAQPGYSGSPVIVTDSGSDSVVGMLSVAGSQARDAYAIPVSDLADAWPDVLSPVVMPACPYRWLSAFSQADAEEGLFVGREHEIVELRRLVDREKVVVVTGSSGVGKSSLVAAGLAKTLNADGWGIGSVLPGAAPVDALGKTLLKLERPSSGWTARALQRYVRQLRSEGLAGLGSKIALVTGKPILISVDPLDEIFNEELCLPRLRSEFLEIILSAAKDPPRQLHVVCALRSDFISELLDHPDSASCLRGGFFMLSPMGKEQIKRVIEEPALKRGVRYDKGLASVIADDADCDGSLPLLEFALAELWPYQRQRHIRLDDYMHLGRVSGALGRHAERIYQELSTEFGEDQIRRVLLAFVTAGPSITKHRPVVRDKFTERQQSLIDRLISARLMIGRREEPQGEDVYEIAHAALLENWERLSTWIAEDRKFLDWHSYMRTFSKGDLLPESRLAEARIWLAERAYDVDKDIRHLIERSQTHYERQVQELQQARDQAELAARRAESLRLASLSEQATATRAPAGVALAVESLLRLHTVQGDLALRRALVHAAQPFSLPGHENPVNAIAFSRDGELIVTASEDGVTRVFSASGDQRCSYKQFGSVKNVAFNASGDRVLSAGRSGQVCIIESATGEPLRRIEHHDAVNCAVFSPNGQLVATACDDGIARVFRCSTGRKMGVLAHNGPVKAVIFSPDGRLIATASDDGSARVYRLTSKAEEYRVIHGGPVNSVAFSPDGHLIMTASDDGFVRVFDGDSGTEQAQINIGSPAKGAIFSHDGDLIAMTGGMPDRGVLRVQRASSGLLVIERQDRELLGCAAFSYDDELIVVAGKSGAVRVFELSTGTEWTGLGHDGPVNSVDFSPSARRAASASADCSARVFDPAPGPERSRVTHKGTVNHIEFTSDGDWLMSASEDGTVLVFDPATGDERHRFAHEAAVHTALISPVGNFVVTAGEDGLARLYDLSTGAERGQFEHDGPVWSLAVSHDSAWIATGSGDRTARILNVESGREHLRTPLLGPVTSVDFSSDGRWIVTTNGGRGRAAAVHVFAVDSGAERLSIAHSDWVNRAIFSPDGKWIATAGDDGNACVFDTATGAPRSRLKHRGRVSAVAFSSDGEWVATASDDGTARVFDPATGKERSQLAHDKWANAAVFSSNNLVATGSYDGTARIFDPATGIERNRVIHEMPVLGVAVSPDTEWLATASADGSVRVSPIGLSSLLATALIRMTRPLTRSEQQRYEVTSLLGQDAETRSSEETIYRRRGDPGFNWLRHGDYVVVEVNEELDVYTSPQLRHVLIGLVNRGNYRLIIDLRGMTFLDSTGLGVLTGGLKRVRAHDGECLVVSDREPLNKIFRLTGMTKVFGIYDSVEQALGASLVGLLWFP